MPAITKIAQQAHSASRYSIYIDGMYTFSLSDLELSIAGLREGQTLTETELEGLVAGSQVGKARDKAMHYLSFRPRSISEVRIYLRGKQFEDVVIEQAIERLLSNGMLNDTEFAAVWIRERQALRPRSKPVLAYELRSKGLSSDDIELALQEVGDDVQIEAILQIARKKLAQPKYHDQRYLFDYLMRQGFPAYLVRRAMEELS